MIQPTLLGLNRRVFREGYTDYARHSDVECEAIIHFKLGMTALEIGPGEGAFANLFVRIGYKLSTIDNEVRSQPGKMWVMDIQTTHLKEVFDLIHCGQTLEHFSNHSNAMTNIVKMASKYTLLLISSSSQKGAHHRKPLSKASFEQLMDKFIIIATSWSYRGKGAGPQHMVAGHKK